MTNDYNQTVLLFIRILRSQKHIKYWDEAAKLYSDLTSEAITIDNLKKQIKKIKYDMIDQKRLDEYLVKTSFYATDEAKEPEQELHVLSSNAEDSNVVRQFSIPRSDFKTIFGIDDADPDDIKIKKIKDKMAKDDFALNYLGYDPNWYYIDKRIPCAWNTSMKIKQKDGHDQVYMVINESDRLVIKKRKEPLYENNEFNRQILLDDLQAFLNDHLITPFDLFKKSQTNKTSLLDNNLCLVCPGLELHLGKLGSKDDYEDFSSKHALWRVKKLAQELYEYQMKNRAGTLILGVGNDFFNSDTLDDKTPAGTQQNNDTRYKSMYLWGVVAYMQLIESMRPYFNKIVLKFNPGNHDEKSAFSLYTNLFCLYNMKKDSKVELYDNIKKAKVMVGLNYNDIHFNTAYMFGDNLFIFAHSKTPNSKFFNDKALAELAINTFPNEYHKANHTYIFAGHIHQDGEATINGTTVTVLRTPSLSGHGAWDSENGYLGAREGHTIYLFSEKSYLGKQNVTIEKQERAEKIASVKASDHDIIANMKDTLSLTSDGLAVAACQKKIAELKASLEHAKKKCLTKAHQIAACAKKNPNNDEALLNYTTYNEETKDKQRELDAKIKVLSKFSKVTPNL